LDSCSYSIYYINDLLICHVGFKDKQECKLVDVSVLKAVDLINKTKIFINNNNIFIVLFSVQLTFCTCSREYVCVQVVI